MAPLVDHSALGVDLRRRCALDDAQVHAALRTLWIAATSTTKRVLASSVLLLAGDPALRDQVTAEPALLDAFIGESIRLHPPELLIGRVTTAPVTLGGQQIPERGIVQLCIGAANRDPDRFPDPDHVRLDRTQQHLAFGSGAHGCPGAGLAGTQARIALSALLRLAPSFELAQPACMMRYVPSATTHGLEQLVVNRGRDST
jgi:cytochrome P450